MEEETQQYSLNELNAIANGIQSLLQRSKSADISYSRNLLYLLSKNLRIIENETKIVSEQMQDDIPEFEEYRKEVFSVAIECGGKMREYPDGGQYVDMQTDEFDKEEFAEKKVQIDTKFSDTIEHQQKINVENEKVKQEAFAEVKWHGIPLDYFPEEGSVDDIPYVINDLITT